MSPRVLIVAPRLDIGGTEMHIARILPPLRRRRLDISLFLLSRGGRLEEALRTQEVPVYGPCGSGPRILRLAMAAVALRAEVRRLRPEIVHFFLPEAYLVGSLALAGLGQPVRIMSRRSLSLYQRNHPLLAWLERRLHRSMAALLGNSAVVAAELAAECQDRRKIAVIHNGIDIPAAVSREQRLSVRANLGIPEEAFVIVVIANLIPYKGHHELLEALGAIQHRLQSPWLLMLIGRDEGVGQELRQKATTLGIASNIMWMNELVDAQSVLRAADIGVLPSHQEGFSNSLLEKMACGLAVVATNVGGNIDAILDGECGRLVPVRNPKALAAAIVELYDDAALRERLGTAARERVARLFSLEACVERYLNLYRGIRGIGMRPVAQLVEARYPSAQPAASASS